MVGLAIGVLIAVFVPRLTTPNPQSVTVQGAFLINDGPYCPCTRSSIRFVPQTGQEVDAKPNDVGAYTVTLRNHQYYNITLVAFDSHGNPLKCGSSHLNLDTTLSTFIDDVTC